MKILFVTYMYSANVESGIAKNGGLIHHAANKLQWAIVEGLVKNSADFDVVSYPATGCFPKNFHKLYVMDDDIIYNGRVIGKSEEYFASIFFKDISIKYRLRSYIKNWIKANRIGRDENFSILLYTPYSPFICAIESLKKDYPNMKVSCIVTDLIEDVFNWAGNKSLLKKIQISMYKKRIKRGYKFIDKYILLSEFMVEKIPEARGKYVVVEGIYGNSDNIVAKEKFEKTLLYTGGLEEFGGVRILVNAFMKTVDPEFKLIVCGYGALAEYVENASRIDNRIIFKGIVNTEEAVRLQKSSTAVINPRQPNGGITKYSFPSKTMEYLTSGNPMIGYKLEGIPDEYFRYFYAIKDTSEAGLTNAITEVLSLPREVLEKKGAEARLFIETEKNAKRQVRKILEFIES